MSKGSYPYPADEFDAADDHDGPRGVHRAHRSMWHRARPFLRVLVLLPALAYGFITWIANTDTGLSGAISGLGSTQASDPSPSVSAPSAAPGSTKPPVAPPVASPAATPAPDLTAPIAVLNAANVSGLAATETKKLQSGGFTKVTASNHAGAGVTTTTVFYATDAQKATADAAAALLGIKTVTKSATQAASGITVVLTSDYPH